MSSRSDQGVHKSINAREVEPVEVPASGWPPGPRVRMLSVDKTTGAFSGVLELPAGWRREAGMIDAEVELFVLDGALMIGGRARGFGFYEHAPAGTEHPAVATETDASMLFFARDRAPHFRVTGGEEGARPRAPGAQERRIELDTERLPWSFSSIAGPPPGHVHKVLRRDERTGEMCVLLSSVPHRDYPALEFHDCVEEYFVIEGEVWLGNSGLMTAGSYFWRPPFITHGPFYSATGALSIVWVPSTLVNHIPAGPRSTPEQNLARFVAAGGARVLADRARGMKA